jgi:probable HAF family extracellular repeat protein
VPYVITDLSSGIAYPTAINASGDVVGQASVACGGSLSCNRAFRYTSGTGLATQLGVIGEGTDVYYSTVHGINANGDAVGSLPEAVPDASYPGCATLFPAGGGRECLLPGTRSVALALNDSGLIVGYKVDYYDGSYGSRAFLYGGGIVTNLHAEIATLEPAAIHSEAAAINASGDIVGWFDRPCIGSSCPSATQKYPFVRHHPVDDQPPVYEFLSLPSGLEEADAEPTGINGLGQVVGTTNLTSGSEPLAAILWSGGTVQDLGTLPDSPLSQGSAALGINGRSELVGGSYYEFLCSPSSCHVSMHAFLYRDGAMHDLNDLIPADSGWILEVATAINDAGQIVVSGRHSSGGSGAVLLTPASIVLIDDLVGLVESFDLPHGLENSLVKKLQNALAALEAGDTVTACGLLGAFINETRAQSGKKLTVEQADEMIDNAEQIRAVIGCQ